MNQRLLLQRAAFFHAEHMTESIPARAFRDWAGGIPNPLTRALTARRAEGREVIDLIGVGAHDGGLGFPVARLAALAAEVAHTATDYHPDPQGQRTAREAIAAFYERRGLPTDPDRVLLTPGTSMAYLYLMRLLLEPNDEVLVPSPGYPLFDDLARFAGVRQRFYHLRSDAAGWQLDFDDLEFQITPRTRMLILVSPHNPLGTVLDAASLDRVGALAEQHRLHLVFDEVFSEFSETPIARPRRAFILNGLSKMLALPGLKIGWIRLDEPSMAVREALQYASDLFLPVAETSQAMVAPLLREADAFTRQLSSQLAQRRQRLVAALQMSVVPARAGVYVCLAVDGDEDALALRALDGGVLVHPGHFYRLPGHLVMTCLGRPEHLEEGARRLRDVIGSGSDQR